MKCHYEVLGVDRSASDGDIKRAYRRLALKLHPDKNQDNVDECTRLFTAVQQAYEVLSDPQERAWYDKHREDILRGAGSDFKDDSFNLMPFFSTTCFSGYNDDKKGFYAVYIDVFYRVGEEEVPYMDEDDEPLPSFGDSTSDYESVVHSFYSYWQSFTTHKSYAWEDMHDLRDAPNRRVQRLMEKENKKLREAAKRKTNETVRALVAFVRKRDKRVQAYKLVLEEREMVRQQKVAEKRAKDREKRLKLQEEYQRDPTHSEAAALFEEELQSMATQLDQEFGKDSDSSGEESIDEDLFCPACNKMFRTDKSFANHQRSKKHRENAALLRKLLQEEDADLQAQQSHDNCAQSVEDKLEELSLQTSSTLTLDSTKEEVLPNLSINNEIVSESAGVGVTSTEVGGVSSSDTDEDVPLELLRNKKSHASRVDTVEVTFPEAVERSSPPSPTEDNDVHVPYKAKKKGKGKGKKKASGAADLKASQSQLNYCNVCKSDFPSRNKLFQHIKDTGHAIHVNSDQPKLKTSKNSRRKK
ncbi:dnaJ homolog subfamily C member 21-like isoform X2 [Halichondria panicea]|uniref:dnaJ homolog subfamily C member 21-like isoform X2 n=1 Tax=Halichondria panicea TaxID=6063 RepID=UPI00312B4A89